MDIYLLLLLLGGIGLAAMGLMGLGAHGHDAGGHGDLAGHGHHGHDGGHHEAAGPSPLWQLMSPRIIFAVLLGAGVTGVLLRPLLGSIPLAAASAAGGIALERLVVLPLWNFLMRFSSRPALTLESALTADALVVSTFDASGHGLVSIEVDGQVVQLLARLRAAELAPGVQVRAGDRVRVDAIDTVRNRCTVSRL